MCAQNIFPNLAKFLIYLFFYGPNKFSTKPENFCYKILKRLVYITERLEKSYAIVAYGMVRKALKYKAFMCRL